MKIADIIKAKREIKGKKHFDVPIPSEYFSLKNIIDNLGDDPKDLLLGSNSVSSREIKVKDQLITETSSEIQRGSINDTRYLIELRIRHKDDYIMHAYLLGMSDSHEFAYIRDLVGSQEVKVDDDVSSVASKIFNENKK